MLDIKFVRENYSTVEKTLDARGASADLARLKEIDARRLALLQEIESLRHRRNTVSEQIAGMKKAGQDASGIMAEMREVSAAIKEKDKTLGELDNDIREILLQIPNIPHASVPVGRNEADNVLVRKVGEPPAFDFEPKAHWDVGEALGILDFERASKLAGARFSLYLGAGARLERALINFMLDTHTSESGYREVLPPFMVNRTAMTSTGQLPKFEEDLFKIEGSDHFLIPTAEVPVTNIHQGEILDGETLPLYYTAFTPCFRSEAGSYGKDTRGLIRLHQFNKVELVKFVAPETSYEELETLTANAESILARLGLAYQVITLCSGDLGFSAAKTYDIEVWMPEQGVYREISSCSNFEDYQARRGGIRYREKGKKGTTFVHTLNGSGLAVGRCVAAILENFQEADGSVRIPEALQPYMGGLEKLVP